MIPAIPLVFSFNSNAESSDLGSTGLIDTPTARMLNDGDFKASLSFQKIANIYNSTYQATPWLETTFRYTIFNPGRPFGLRDRSYAAKIKLFNEGEYLPQIALGIQDIFETSINFNVIFLFSIIFSFFISFLTIKYFLIYVKNFDLKFFVYYRIFLAFILFIVVYV